MTLGQMGRVTRPTRLARQLAGLGDLTVLATPTGSADWRPEGAAHVLLPPRDRSLSNQFRRAARLLVQNFEQEIWDASLNAARESLTAKPFNFVFCEDLTLLPLAVALSDEPQNAGRAKIVMDAREFYPRQFEHKVVWRTFLGPFNDYLCRTYLPRCDHVFTVSPGLQDAFREQYGVSCQLLPSCAPWHDISPRPTGPRVRIIHHGSGASGRKLEVMIETVKRLDERFSLDLMLVPSDVGYFRKLKNLTDTTPRIRIIPPVPMPNIVEFISQYDIGLCILEPTTFKLWHCLPNKFFEFLQARLAIAIGPSPDMAHIVKSHGLGIVADDFTPEAMAMRLNALTTAEIDVFKASSHAAAKTLCWERNEELIAAVLGGDRPA